MTEWESRDRKRPIKVYVSVRERSEIERRAAGANLPASTLMRMLALGFIPRAAFDRQAIEALIRLHADQGRLGGLLKLWLVEKPGQGASEVEIRRLLERLGDLQTTLAEIVGRV